MLIYLADTVHHARGQLNPGTVPYNVARIAAYCQNKYPEHDFRLFKDPHALLDALRSQPPDILALSNYFWNAKLNHGIARYARSLHPGIIIVTGGPNLDRNESAYRAYAQEHPYVDFVIVEEGETCFANIIGKTYEGCFGVRNMRLYPSQARVRNLDEFPSPYLNGMLDSFLEAGLRPILETVRGCPYRCAFCEQGSEFFTKIAPLSVERVAAEVEYIRGHTKADQLILADVNFGILKRDLEVAKFLKASHLEHGWPRSLYVYNAKLPTETTLQTMETLYPMAQLCMSFQSTSEEVLENIHRSNIGYDKYSFITKWAKARNLPVGTELIYGLPGETRKSFVDGYETLLGFRADYMASYNLRLFSGIELNSPEKRKQYDVKTRFRPMDVHLGEYLFEKKERIVEIEEIVLSNSTLSEDDYFHVRRLAFLVEALWNTGYLRPALAFLANQGHRITDILQDILGRGHEFFDEYDQLVHDELAEDPDVFLKDWDNLVAGRSLKINLAFAGRLLLFEDDKMSDFFDDCLMRYAAWSHWKDIFEEILLHCHASRANLDHPEPVERWLHFDVPEWVRSGYPKDVTPFKRHVKYRYELESVCLPAIAVYIKHMNESFNHMAERVIMEVPEVYRRTRIAKGIRAHATATDDLGQRMAWAG